MTIYLSFYISGAKMSRNQNVYGAKTSRGIQSLGAKTSMVPKRLGPKCLGAKTSVNQMISMNTCGEGRTISSFANRNNLCPIILNYMYALLKHLTCQDFFLSGQIVILNMD